MSHQILVPLEEEEEDGYTSAKESDLPVEAICPRELHLFLHLLELITPPDLEQRQKLCRSYVKLHWRRHRMKRKRIQKLRYEYGLPISDDPHEYIQDPLSSDELRLIRRYSKRFPCSSALVHAVAAITWRSPRQIISEWPRKRLVEPQEQPLAPNIQSIQKEHQALAQYLVDLYNNHLPKAKPVTPELIRASFKVDETFKELWQYSDRPWPDPPFPVVNEVDDEPFPRVEFISTYRINDRVPLPDQAFVYGCSCTDGCRRNCECVQLSLEESPQPLHPSVVGQPPYRRGLLNDAWNGRSYEGDKLTIYECTSACACRKTPDKPCQNNVIGQHKRPWKLELFKTVDRGWGVRTREFIPRGAFIAEYIGEIISRETGVLRDTAYHIAQLLYMFNLDRFVGADDPNMLVADAYYYCNEARFFNHSCASNMVQVTFFADTRDASWVRLGLFARRDIKPGEELTFDYKSTDAFPVCQCGAPNCRSRQQPVP